MDHVEFAIVRVVVPVALAGGIVVAFVGAGRTFARVRTAAYGGFWAGLALTVFWLLVVADAGLAGTHELDGASFWLWFAVGAVVVGLPAGIVLPALFLASRRRRRVGLVLLLLASGTSGCLVDTLLWPASRGFTTGVTLTAVVCSCLAFITPRSAAKQLGSTIEEKLDDATIRLFAWVRTTILRQAPDDPPAPGAGE